MTFLLISGVEAAFFCSLIWFSRESFGAAFAESNHRPECRSPVHKRDPFHDNGLQKLVVRASQGTTGIGEAVSPVRNDSGTMSKR